MSFEYPNYCQRYELLKKSIYKLVDPTTRLKISRDHYKAMQEFMNKQKEQE